MDRDETVEAGAAPAGWDPPPGSGIVVREDADGARITLPRLYSQGDVIVTLVSAVLAVWMAVWVDALGSDPSTMTLGWAVMAGIGLLFGVLAVTQAVPIVAPRVIQDRDDRIVLSRAVGVRLLLRHEVPKSAIRSVERVWEAGEADPTAGGVVRIRTDRHAYRLGKGLDTDAAAWLVDAVGAMAER